MYEGTSDVSTANEAAVEIEDEENESVGNTMTPAEINELIEAHVPLVKHIVFQVAVHFPRHVEREELARAGALGLVEAAQRYSPDRGIPFQRFAARRVRGAMLDAVRAADWAPRSVRRLSRRFDAMEQQLASELGRAPRTAETAEALGMKPTEVAKLRSQLYRSVVLALEHDVDGENGEDLNLLDVFQIGRTLGQMSSSKDVSSTPISKTQFHCCQSAIAWSLLVISSKRRRRLTSPDSLASPSHECHSCALMPSRCFESAFSPNTKMFLSKLKPVAEQNVARRMPMQSVMPATGGNGSTKVLISAPVSAPFFNTGL